jgi:hypothetical protein
VYPFSMVMVPMYILMIPTESIQTIRKTTSNTWLNSGYLAFMTVAAQYAVTLILRGNQLLSYYILFLSYINVHLYYLYDLNSSYHNQFTFSNFKIVVIYSIVETFVTMNFL